MLRDHQRGLPIPDGQRTVEQFLARWLEDVVRSSVRPLTFISYCQLVRGHIVPALGSVVLSKLTPQQVQAFMNAKLSDGLSPRTVQYLRAVLRRALNQALRWDLVVRNVATLVDPPHVARAEIKPLTPTELAVFLDAVRGERFEALYILAIAAGLRRGELLGLQWPDLDFDKATLRVRRALQRPTLEELEVKAVDVLRNVQNVAMSDIRQLFTEAGHLRSIEDLPPAVAAAISSVEVVTKQAGAGQVEHVAKVRLWDKMRALELLVKYLQLIKPEPTGREAIVAELFPAEVLNAMSNDELAVAKKLLQRKLDALRS